MLEWCQVNRDKYKVEPMKSWGKLPMNMIEIWKTRKCDLVFTTLRMGKKPISTCVESQPKPADPAPRKTGFLFNKLQNILSTNGSTVDLASHPNMQANLPLISILAGTTTRRVKKPSTKNMALFIYLLPSLIRTLDCGFRYEYVLGYDKGDPFYDSDIVRNLFFTVHVE